MADERHEEKLVFETEGAEASARKIDKLIDKLKEKAESVKDLGKEAKKSAKMEAEAAKSSQESAKKQAKAAEATRNAVLGVAGAFALVVKRAGEALVVWSQVDAANGRLKTSLGNSADAADRVEKAFNRAQATFKDWERFGATAQEQTEALRDLVDTTGNYEQSMNDVSLALDLAAAKNITFERAAESVRKVRQGEVEVLKELGIVSKGRAEDLGRIEDETHRVRTAIVELSSAVGGGAVSNAGLATDLDALGAKLETTEAQLGRISAALVEDGTGLIAAMGEFTGILDEGEHPLDAFNSRLETLAGHAENGDWEKLAGVVLLGNPATAALGLSLLGIASSPSGGSGAAADMTPRNPGQWDVDEPLPVPTSGSAVGTGDAAAPAQRDDGSGALATQDVEFADVWQDIWQEAYGRDIEAKQAAEQAKRDAFNETLRVEAEGREFLDGLRRKTADMEAENAEKAEKKRKKILEENAKATKQAKDAAMAGVEAGAALAQSFVKDEGAKAVISAAMETARAIAAGASGNIPGAIAHGAAAVQFGVVAAKAGMGVESKGAGASGAAASGGAAMQRQDRDRIGSIGGGSAEQQPPAPININIGSTLGFHPDQTREFVDELGRELSRRTGGTLGGVRR